MDHSEVKHLPKVDHTPAQFEDWQLILLKAADYMEVNGKSCNGWHESAKCALITIWHVSVPGQPTDAVHRFRNHVCNLGYCDISDFNEHHSKDEVVAKLRAVAFSS